MNKPLKILILDNTRDQIIWGARNLVHWALKTSPEGSEVIVRRSPHGDLPSFDFKPDAIVLSGSSTSCMEKAEPWIASYDQLVTHHIQAGTPILGVCYGHQTVSRCLFKLKGQEPKLRTAPSGEHGWADIQIIDDSILFEGLHKKFVSFQSHFEEVYEAPPGVRVFAESERCKIQAFQVVDRPIFGIQFHPEYTIEEGERNLVRKKEMGVRPDTILNPLQGSRLYDENVGKVIFGNFFKLASSRRTR